MLEEGEMYPNGKFFKKKQKSQGWEWFNQSREEQVIRLGWVGVIILEGDRAEIS